MIQSCVTEQLVSKYSNEIDLMQVNQHWGRGTVFWFIGDRASGGYSVAASL